MRRTVCAALIFGLTAGPALCQYSDRDYNAYGRHSSEHRKTPPPDNTTTITKTPRLRPWETDVYRGDPDNIRIPERYYRRRKGPLY